MRAVALSDNDIQAFISENFVPLKIEIEKGTPELPLNWKALSKWQRIYQLMGGDETRGFTMCSVISPDLEMELGNTGSAHVWELFESTAYDKEKFLTMLNNAAIRADARNQHQTKMSNKERGSIAGYFRWKRNVEKEIRVDGRLTVPPKGFSKEAAMELFEMTGDAR